MIAPSRPPASNLSVSPEPTPVPIVSTGIVRLDVATILGDAKEVILVHNGGEYRLRITAAEKLILTK
ncbi:MAG: hemin uptake protein HemP [Rhizobiales bacterium PAR1]|nr:MAG: hemin uptake protein HemP [Rhizobiales bacterium PAR1]